MKSTLLQFKAEEGLETIGAHAFEGLHFWTGWNFLPPFPM